MAVVSSMSRRTALRRAFHRRAPAERESGDVPQALGPEPGETTAAPARELKSPHQPSTAERAAHKGYRMPFRPWCPACV
eukprot:2655892-Pyramimonas_sp.AAC.1